ncbi:hypothetical protein COCCADRAFT_10127 [Bipolaris zeicola 26-R-13]|uniref:Uncharacterized protein n=1 Tax=Cochliobolus carbonum (strain 26-R-13) TaxID=930089 RepID=W6Y835_COCC2|nr:uncharacterized protein COCCADRAFT_10127 [Bipolaris zeicola 26-R-13]EUC27226.1 hypothetical protein COCCADRAFT_10127 [Bipolaris zeicola 26-R-13]
MSLQTPSSSSSGSTPMKNYNGFARVFNSPHTISPSVPLQDVSEIIEDAVQQALSTQRRELMAAMTKQCYKPMHSLTAEIKSLKHFIEKRQKHAPVRSLDAILLRVVFKLTMADTEKMSKTIPAERLQMVQSLGYPYDQATSVRIYPNLNELVVFTDSLPVQEELKKKERVAAMAGALGLEHRSSIKLDSYWVILHEYDLPADYLRNCKSHLEEMKSQTGLNISEVKYAGQKLMWAFNTPSEAVKACQKPLYFAGDHAIAMAYDQRATPLFCRKCGGPGHMFENKQCPNFSFRKDQSWPCIICAENHTSEGDTQSCPNKGNKASHRCLNCRRAGLADDKHRTESHDCPAPNTVKFRAIWKAQAASLPNWAVGIDFPTTDQLRSQVERGTMQQPNGPNKVNRKGKFNGPVQTAGESSLPGTTVVNRKGLMAPKNAKQPASEPEAMEVVDSESSDDKPKDGATRKMAMLVSSQSSLGSSSASTPRKTGSANNQTSIFGWVERIGSTPKSPTSTASSAGNKTNASPSVRYGRSSKTEPKHKKGSAATTIIEGRKRAREESEPSLRGSRSRRRVDIDDFDTASTLAESSSSQKQATDTVDSTKRHGKGKGKGKARVETRESDVECVEESEYDGESAFISESDEYE